jgi:hypothetical protein
VCLLPSSSNPELSWHIEFIHLPFVEGDIELMNLPLLIFAYFSPETILPLSSIIATIAGCALMVKRSSIRFAIRSFQAVLRRRSASQRVRSPHFQVSEKERNQTIHS